VSREDTLRFLAAMVLPAMAVCVVSTLASFNLAGEEEVSLVPRPLIGNFPLERLD